MVVQGDVVQVFWRAMAGFSFSQWQAERLGGQAKGLMNPSSQDRSTGWVPWWVLVQSAVHRRIVRWGVRTMRLADKKSPDELNGQATENELMERSCA